MISVVNRVISVLRSLSQVRSETGTTVTAKNVLQLINTPKSIFISLQSQSEKALNACKLLLPKRISSLVCLMKTREAEVKNRRRVIQNILVGLVLSTLVTNLNCGSLHRWSDSIGYKIQASLHWWSKW